MTRSGLPKTHREVRLRVRPDGLPRPTDFAVVDVPVPVPGPGQVLVRNCWSRVSASTRMLISGGLDQVDGIPFGGTRPGEVPADLAVGEVVASGGAEEDTDQWPAAPEMGDLVGHTGGWREYAVVPIAACDPIDTTVPDPAVHLAHTWTAYAALRYGAVVAPGDTVLVTAAAGSIGATAARLARHLGAARVIGTTSSTAKAARLVTQAGYDQVLARHGGPIAAQLAAAAPDGIDVLIDNVGGDQLAAAAAAARVGARLVVIGALSGQLDPVGHGTTAPVALDSFALLVRRVTLRGFSADDVGAAERARFDAELGAWLRAGELTVPVERVGGLDAAPQALCDLIDGRYLGTVVVQL